MSDEERNLSTNRKRRGVVRASITRLDGRVSELEGKPELSPADRRSAQTLLAKLNELDADFKSYHFHIVDLTEEESLDAEQTILDEHDDRIVNLSTRLQQLVSEVQASSSVTESTPQQRLTKRFSHPRKE